MADVAYRAQDVLQELWPGAWCQPLIFGLKIGVQVNGKPMTRPDWAEVRICSALRITRLSFVDGAFSCIGARSAQPQAT